jgi:hypothetical protein
LDSTKNLKICEQLEAHLGNGLGNLAKWQCGVGQLGNVRPGNLAMWIWQTHKVSLAKHPGIWYSIVTYIVVEVCVKLRESSI